MHTTLKHRRGMAVAGAVIAAATLATSVGTAQAASSDRATTKLKHSATVTHTNTLSPAVRQLVKGSGVHAEAKAVSAYWTPARMKAAVSLDKQVISGKAPARKATTPQGAAKSIKAAAPIVALKRTNVAVSPKYSFPNLPYYAPTARTVGKVFFSRTYGGQTWNYVCSGAIVNSEGKSTVWTAGHCVYDYADGNAKTKPRVWDTNFTFVPSYSNGSAPYGYWYSRSLTTMSSWMSNRDYANDNGAAFMNRNYGYRIADYLGAQGLAWNQSANFYASAFGYPQAYPFNGAYLVKATANTVSAGNVIYMYSGLTGGSSGGPWLRNYDGNYGQINGHNDFIYTNSPSYMYSPYYGNQVASLYNAVRYQSS
ncbi:hypothetical protein [Branchiibius sp. NY16-3462-2]|uniref:trypsin-like serine peptidase n=1 Tax=Branchiibius sp. NY16-3462-2 TaxID=1807500 RepID=UPI0007916740|nr:hypothetical protein [Branchiibius sp. NY16-3462-2]KYH45041.1 hypothetical protein AZH51_14230 [Branchiibius sp. NY16-3462-2]